MDNKINDLEGIIRTAKLVSEGNPNNDVYVISYEDNGSFYYRVFIENVCCHLNGSENVIGHLKNGKMESI